MAHYLAAAAPIVASWEDGTAGLSSMEGVQLPALWEDAQTAGDEASAHGEHEEIAEYTETLALEGACARRVRGRVP